MRHNSRRDLIKKNRHGRPRFIPPMLCKPVSALPEGDDWFYEVKQDGYRALAVKDGERVTLFSHDARPLDYPEAEDAVRRLETRNAVIDCGIIALNSEGNPCFEGLDTSRRGCMIRLYAFDLLHLDGRDVMNEPIERRKERLCTITLASALLFSPCLNCEPEMLIEQVTQLSLEGVVAKRKGSTYEPGKCSGAWMNMRVSQKSGIFRRGLWSRRSARFAYHLFRCWRQTVSAPSQRTIRAWKARTL